MRARSTVLPSTRGPSNQLDQVSRWVAHVRAGRSPVGPPRLYRMPVGLQPLDGRLVSIHHHGKVAGAGIADPAALPPADLAALLPASLIALPPGGLIALPP